MYVKLFIHHFPMIAQRIWWIYHNYFKKTRALRAHTPRTLHAQHISHLHCHATWTYAVDDLSLHVWGQSCAWAESICICIVGMADGHGCDGQLKYTICDACRPWHSILSILKLVYRQLRQIRYTYESLGCLDLKIWWFFCGWWQQQQRHDRLLYPLRMHAGQ